MLLLIETQKVALRYEVPLLFVISAKFRHSNLYKVMKRKILAKQSEISMQKQAIKLLRAKLNMLVQKNRAQKQVIKKK